MEDEKNEGRDRLLKSVSVSVRIRAGDWCRRQSGEARSVVEYLRVFLAEPRAGGLSSSLGLGEYRALAGWVLLRLIAATHSRDERKSFDLEAAERRLRGGRSQPTKLQAAEYWASLTHARAWTEFRRDLELLDKNAAEMVWREALELMLSLRVRRQAEREKVIYLDSRRPRNREPPRKAALAEDLLDRIFNREPAERERRGDQSASRAPAGRGHLRRVV